MEGGVNGREELVVGCCTGLHRGVFVQRGFRFEEGIHLFAYGHQRVITGTEGRAADRQTVEVIARGAVVVGCRNGTTHFDGGVLQHQPTGTVGVFHQQEDGTRFVHLAREGEFSVDDDGVRQWFLVVMAHGDELHVGTVGQAFDVSRQGISVSGWSGGAGCG